MTDDNLVIKIAASTDCWVILVLGSRLSRLMVLNSPLG